MLGRILNVRPNSPNGSAFWTAMPVALNRRIRAAVNLSVFSFMDPAYEWGVTGAVPGPTSRPKTYRIDLSIRIMCTARFNVWPFMNGAVPITLKPMRA